MGEYRIQVINWIIVRFSEGMLAWALDIKFEVSWGIPASRDVGASVAPFMALCFWYKEGRKSLLSPEYAQSLKGIVAS